MIALFFLNNEISCFTLNLLRVKQSVYMNRKTAGAKKKILEFRWYKTLWWLLFGFFRPIYYQFYLISRICSCCWCGSFRLLPVSWFFIFLFISLVIKTTTNKYFFILITIIEIKKKLKSSSHKICLLETPKERRNLNTFTHKFIHTPKLLTCHKSF